MGFNPETPIGDLIEFSRGGGWGKEEAFEGSARVAVVRGADFPDVEAGRYFDLPIRYEKEAKVRSVALRAGDIVLENSGGTDTRPTGRTVLISQELLDAYDCPVIPASFCRIVRFNTTVDNGFIYYWLQNMFNAGRTWGYQNRSTGLSNFQFKTFAEMELVPELRLETQMQIGRVLSSLDKKRLANNRLNGYLEELLLAKCAALENEVEESCTVADYCKRIYSGGTPSTKISTYWDGALPWLSSGETRARFIIDTEKTITPEGVEGSATKLANRGSVVMASAGQGFTRGQTSMLLFDTYVNQSVVVMEPKEKCGSYLLFALATRYDELRAWSDSTSTRGSMSGKVLKQFILPRLTKEQLEQFESLARPQIHAIESNLRESKSLVALRDTLLPKLMSGEIDVLKVDLTQLNSHLA